MKFQQVTEIATIIDTKKHQAYKETMTNSNKIHIPLTAGNLGNNHIYLSQHIDFFPKECIGGRNRSQEGKKLTIEPCCTSEPIETDIAGDKKIFRRRGFLWDFFDYHKLDVNDVVVIEKVGEYEYKLYPERHDLTKRISKSEGSSTTEESIQEEKASRYITIRVKQAVWKRDGGKCTICESKSDLEFDHEIPHSWGGSNYEGNIRLLCRTCNRTKSANL